jgi:hypothetical protein
MADASIVVTAGSGTNLHSDTRSYSGSTKHDQYVLPAEFTLPSYVALGASVSIATINDHVIQLMAGSSLNVRIRRIKVEQSSNATTAAATSLSIMRLTTAGTGGSGVTPASFDTADSASGATARTLPSSKGTESTELLRAAMVWRQAVSATGSQFDDIYEWVQHPGMKPIIIPAGTSNGICIKTTSAVAGATVHVTIEFTETAFV